MERTSSSPAHGARSEKGLDDVITPVETPVAKFRTRSRNDSGYISASSQTASPFNSNSSPCIFKFEELPADAFDQDQVLGNSFTGHSTPVFYASDSASGDSARDLTEKLVKVKLDDTYGSNRINAEFDANDENGDEMDTGLDAEVLSITNDMFKGPISPPVDIPRPSAPVPHVLATQDQFQPIEDEGPVNMATDMDIDPADFVARQRSASLPEVAAELLRQQEVGQELRRYGDEFYIQHGGYRSRRALSVQIPVLSLGLHVRIVAESSPLYDISGWPNFRDALGHHSRHTQTDRDID